MRQRWALLASGVYIDFHFCYHPPVALPCPVPCAALPRPAPPRPALLVSPPFTVAVVYPPGTVLSAGLLRREMPFPREAVLVEIAGRDLWLALEVRSRSAADHCALS